MDINLFALLSICSLFGLWRIYDYHRRRSQDEVIRERVAWMLWLAADQSR